MGIVLATGLESFFRLVVSLFLFLFVLAACYFTTVWLGNFQKGKMGKGNIEVIEIHKLTNNKYIEIVRIGKKYYILSVTKERVEKIDIIDEADIELPDTQMSGANESFAQVLERIKNIREIRSRYQT